METSGYDIVVVGAGNAALCSAITASEMGKKVLVLEKAPENQRGGNSKFTRNFRIAHEKGWNGFTQEYSGDEFLSDIRKVTRGISSSEMTRYVVDNSGEAVNWASAHGTKWQKALRSTLHLDRTNLFILGGGKALLNTYFRYLGKFRNCRIVYDSELIKLNVENNTFQSLTASIQGRSVEIKGDAVILGSGGFESNLNILREAWGDATDNFIIRGTSQNTGVPLMEMIRHGAASVGEKNDGHMVGVDARSPKYEGGIVTRVDSVIFGIVVNKFAMRFFDEGYDIWPKRYAISGKLIARQPDQIAFSIFDSKSWGMFIPPLYPPIVENSIETLADRIGLNPDELRKTVTEYNAACPEAPGFDFSGLDGHGTGNIEPAKSNWARRIDTPPFYAYPLRPGLTFTYFGLKVDSQSRVTDVSGNPFNNIWAAGEIMAGNILNNGYLGGLGMTIGTLFGITAGKEASS